MAVTDVDWYYFLADRPSLREVNFWRPYGARAFKVLNVGEPFLFKAKAPINRIVGGAIYEGFVSLSISQSWDFFGEGNGVSSPAALIDRIRSITGESVEQVGDREIGCVLLRDAWFAREDDALLPPATFTGNIVQGKSYNYPGEDALVDVAVERTFRQLSQPNGSGEYGENLRPTTGDKVLVTPRLGQAGFKAVVQEAYSRRCAVTGHRILPTLEAAHVVPVARGGQHRVDNGILLRSDVHTLFDRGYVGISEEFRLMVSPRIRSEFGNGEELYAKEGEVIALPAGARLRPSPEFLSWHLNEVFR